MPLCSCLLRHGCNFSSFGGYRTNCIGRCGRCGVTPPYRGGVTSTTPQRLLCAICEKSDKATKSRLREFDHFGLSHPFLVKFCSFSRGKWLTTRDPISEIDLESREGVLERFICLRHSLYGLDDLNAATGAGEALFSGTSLIFFCGLDPSFFSHIYIVT